jgi:hypothetical protein
MRYERPTAGNHYLALISYLPIKHFRAVPKFFRFTLEIQRQLRNASGLIGYALEARPFSKKVVDTVGVARPAIADRFCGANAALPRDERTCAAHG